MDSIIDALTSGDAQKISPALTDFIQKNSQCFTFPELNENSTRKALWKALYDLGANPTQNALHRDCLSAVRILSRDKENLSDMINGDWVNILLLRSGLKDESGDPETAVEALKCLCNLIFNSRQVRALCCENNILDLVVKRASTYKEAQRVSMEIKFFDMKLLFLVTALCAKFRPKLKDDLHGFALLTEILDSVEKENNRCPLSDLHVDFCCEILKTLFNLCAGVGSRDDGDDEGGDAVETAGEADDSFVKLVSVLRDLLLVQTEKKEKKFDLNNHIVNLITIVPDDCVKMLIVPVTNERQVPKQMQFEEQDMSAIYEIVELLKSKFDSDLNVSSQNEMLSPILSALVKCVKANRAIRKYLRLQILPPLRDVHNRPEQGTTIRNCLCRLLTTPITQVRDFTADFLFVLCKENIGRMIKYTGYGNAAGMLANRGLLGGKNGETWNYSSDSEDSETEEYLEHKHGINPVVGCYQPPRTNPTANMTEEQKEYEAMKLVELMDNLTKKGIVKPCKVGPDGRPQPIEHILQLQEGIPDSPDEQDN